MKYSSCPRCVSVVVLRTDLMVSAGWFIPERKEECRGRNYITVGMWRGNDNLWPTKIHKSRKKIHQERVRNTDERFHSDQNRWINNLTIIGNTQKHQIKLPSLSVCVIFTVMNLVLSGVKLFFFPSQYKDLGWNSARLTAVWTSARIQSDAGNSLAMWHAASVAMARTRSSL